MRLNEPGRVGRIRYLDQKMHDPETADNYAVRKEILSRVRMGTITLSEGQKELAKIQFSARIEGKPTVYN